MKKCLGIQETVRVTPLAVAVQEQPEGIRAAVGGTAVGRTAVGRTAVQEAARVTPLAVAVQEGIRAAVGGTAVGGTAVAVQEDPAGVRAAVAVQAAASVQEAIQG